VIVSGSSNLSYSVSNHSSSLYTRAGRRGHTGTFRWVITTEVSFPRTATAVTPDPVIALKAYSDYQLETCKSKELTYRLDRAIPGVSLSFCTNKRLKLTLPSGEKTVRYLSVSLISKGRKDLPIIR
jgi:hypothetical protein